MPIWINTMDIQRQLQTIPVVFIIITLPPKIRTSAAADFMAKQVQLRNKPGMVVNIMLSLVLGSCQPSTQKTDQVPSLFVAADQPGWTQQEGRLFVRNTLFSGWQYQLSPYR